MRAVLLTILFLALQGIAVGEPKSRTEGIPPGTRLPLAQLSAKKAVILGIVEGVTEFIPISSTGHLIVITDLLQLDSNQPLFDAGGKPLWHKPPSENHRGELLTLNLATQSYIVVIQFGAILAVLPVCWPQLMAMLRGLLGQDPAGRRLLISVAMAFTPSALVGLLAHDWIEANLFSEGAVIFGLVAGSLLMYLVERWRKRSLEAGVFLEGTEVSPAAAGFIGFLQCLAMWPGTSRPMMTIVGGYLAGLSPARAAGFSFLLGFVTLNAAAIYKSLQSGSVIVQVFGWENVVLGAGVAAITAAVSVRFFVTLLLRMGLAGFVWYRLLLAGFLALYYYL